MSGDDRPVRHVQRVKTSTGVRLYFRRGDHRRPLKSADDTPELRAEVVAILEELGALERARTPRAGTVGGALRDYRRSADFLGLARSTQASYERLIDEIESDAGDVRLSEVDAMWIDELKSAWAERGHRAANLRLQMLINALAPAIRDGRVSSDPFLKLKKVRRPHDAGEPNPAWTDARWKR